MAVRFSLAKRKAQKLLQRLGVDAPPVPVERVVKLLGAELRYEPFDGELSGMLLRRGSRAMLGINQRHSENRQRFSIAHEIGHLVMHKQEEFHVDDGYAVRFRDENASTGKDEIEVEANQFAAELLMPEDLLRKDVRRHLRRDAEGAVKEMAKRYRVSEQAMAIRLTALGLLV